MNLNTIAEELFAKIRGRFPSVTIGDEEGNVTNEPDQARYYEFTFKEGDTNGNKISVSLDDEDGVVVMYANDVTENELGKDKWYSFLKELRMFAKKRMLNFDVRNITKSNLDKRDYQYLSRSSGDNSMNESKLYGTSKLSYQDVDSARLVIKHTENVDYESPAGRTRNIGAIYIESAEGERFKYPFKHLAGARAMARHVAEGGTTYDEFGSHIVDLSEELNKLRKFKSYMGRSKVMAESLADYMGVVHERIGTVKKRIDNLQKSNYYKEAFEGFEKPVFEDIPDDVKENWIDQLTIRQFNEELKDVFPYIYKLVGEATRAKELGPDDFMAEGPLDKLGRTLKVKTQQGNPKLTDSPEWANFIGRTPEGAWHWLEKESAVETDYADEYFPDAGKTEFTGFVSPKKNAAKVAPLGHTKGIEEAAEKLACLGCDAVSTKAAWKKNGGTCPKCKKSSKGVAEAGNKPVEKSIGMGDTRSAQELKQQIRDLDDKTLSMWAKKKPGMLGSKVAKMQYKLIQSELQRRAGQGSREEDELESYFNKSMGVWAEDCECSETCNQCGCDPKNPDPDCDCTAHSNSEEPLQDELETSLEKNKRKLADLKKLKAEIWASADKETMVAIQKKEYDLKQAIRQQAEQVSTSKEDQQTPLSEFILSFYDRASGTFPKGETAVLTMIEKDYGEQFIEPAKTFIESINQTFEQHQAGSMVSQRPEQAVVSDERQGGQEFDRMRQLAGL